MKRFFSRMPIFLLTAFLFVIASTASSSAQIYKPLTFRKIDKEQMITSRNSFIPDSSDYNYVWVNYAKVSINWPESSQLNSDFEYQIFNRLFSNVCFIHDRRYISVNDLVSSLFYYNRQYYVEIDSNIYNEFGDRIDGSDDIILDIDWVDNRTYTTVKAHQYHGWDGGEPAVVYSENYVLVDRGRQKIVELSDLFDTVKLIKVIRDYINSGGENVWQPYCLILTHDKGLSEYVKVNDTTLDRYGNENVSCRYFITTKYDTVIDHYGEKTIEIRNFPKSQWRELPLTRSFYIDEQKGAIVFLYLSICEIVYCVYDLAIPFSYLRDKIKMTPYGQQLLGIKW